MAEPFRLKLGGMGESMGENILAKEFLGSVEIHRAEVRSMSHRCLFYAVVMTKRPKIGTIGQKTGQVGVLRKKIFKDHIGTHGIEERAQYAALTKST